MIIFFTSFLYCIQVFPWQWWELISTVPCTAFKCFRDYHGRFSQQISHSFFKCFREDDIHCSQQLLTLYPNVLMTMMTVSGKNFPFYIHVFSRRWWSLFGGVSDAFYYPRRFPQHRIHSTTVERNTPKSNSIAWQQALTGKTEVARLAVLR